MKMKKKIFKYFFKKEIEELEERENIIQYRSKLEEMSKRRNGNPLRIYDTFVDRSARCGIIMFQKEGSFQDKIKTLEDRALDLMSPDYLKRKDMIDDWRTFDDEIELLLIRIIVRFANRYGRFPERNPYILESYRDLANERMDILYRFKDEVADKLFTKIIKNGKQ